MQTKRELIENSFTLKQIPKILHIITYKEKEFDYDEWSYLHSEEGELKVAMAISDYYQNNNKVGKAGDRFLHRAYIIENGKRYSLTSAGKSLD